VLPGGVSGKHGVDVDPERHTAKRRTAWSAPVHRRRPRRHADEDDYATRAPSSVSAVMMYVPDFSSRSSSTIFVFAASSRSFEKVE